MASKRLIAEKIAAGLKTAEDAARWQWVRENFRIEYPDDVDHKTVRVAVYLKWRDPASSITNHGGMLDAMVDAERKRE